MPTVITPVEPDLSTVLAPPSAAALAFDPAVDPRTELDRQVQAYVELGVPALLGLDPDDFRTGLLPLAEALPATLPGPSSASASVPDDHIPFVLVLPQVDVNDLVPAMRRGPRLGVSVIDREEAATYRPIEGVVVPEQPYLLWGIDVGSELCDVRPEDALAVVRERGRTPLTIAEGVALTVVRPDMLRPNRCYSLMASRTGTNQRVPAVWISQRRAKLGWCWDRNPHTWLGAASAERRD